MTCSTGSSIKLVDRHPHVFGDVKADTPAEVLRNWEALKALEKEKEAGCRGSDRAAVEIGSAPKRCRYAVGVGERVVEDARADGGI